MYNSKNTYIQLYTSIFLIGSTCHVMPCLCDPSDQSPSPRCCLPDPSSLQQKNRGISGKNGPFWIIPEVFSGIFHLKLGENPHGFPGDEPNLGSSPSIFRRWSWWPSIGSNPLPTWPWNPLEAHQGKPHRSYHLRWETLEVPGCIAVVCWPWNPLKFEERKPISSGSPKPHRFHAKSERCTRKTFGTDSKFNSGNLTNHLTSQLIESRVIFRSHPLNFGTASPQPTSSLKKPTEIPFSPRKTHLSSSMNL